MASYPDWFLDLEAATSGFFNGCATYPENCALDANLSGPELENQFFTFLAQFADSDKVLDETLSGISDEFVQYLYVPSRWSNDSASLQEIYDGIAAANETMAFNATVGEKVKRSSSLRSRKRDSDSDTGSVGVVWPIECGDGTYYGGNITVPEVEAKATEYASSAPMFSPYTLMTNYFHCIGWMQQAAEVYSGDFNVTTNPILFVNSPYDPVTPYESAEVASSLFEGSVLLKHMGYGVRHPSLDQLRMMLTV